MDDSLLNSTTRLLWHYFFELSRIPRESRHEQRAAAWVAEQGRLLGCEVAQDAVGNVRIRKRASEGKTDVPCLGLQAHVDMVCVKTETSTHDFSTDSLRLVREGDLLGARGTSLGADNGIGVAAALALLAEPDLIHGPLEILITVDEERGLTGVRNLEPGWLEADYLLNLDGDGEGILTVGGAGRVDTVATRRMGFCAPDAGWQAFRLDAVGLKGGHSGLAIHRGLGNALKLLAQVLYRLMPPYALSLSGLTCDNPRNAVPRSASAVFFMNPVREHALRQQLRIEEAHWKIAFGGIEPELAFRLLPASASHALESSDGYRIVDLLLSLPHGVEAMSPDFPSLTQTSTNLACARIDNGIAEVVLMTRSSYEASKLALRDRIEAACRLAGFRCVHENDHPSWRPDPHSVLARQVLATFEEQHGRPMTVSTIHADLECGFIGAKYPNLQIASVSPDMWGTHTPQERLSLTSADSFYRLLEGLVTRLAEGGRS